ncbi:MAG: hypothetical protein V4487_05855, partial [Chlamydiota bacterium]
MDASLVETQKPLARLHCLKQPSVLELESFGFTPLHLIALIIFILAIIHTLSVNFIHQLARSLEIRQAPKRQGKKKERSLVVHALYFLSEVE